MKTHFVVAYALILWSFFSVPSAVAQETMYGYFAGPYVMIGKLPDSDKTYFGHAKIESYPDSIRVIRQIGTNKTIGIGKLEKPIHGERDVLRVRFTSAGVKYEATYIFTGDMNNYARLTGYVYRADGKTERAGLEALFLDYGQLQRK